MQQHENTCEKCDKRDACNKLTASCERLSKFMHGISVADKTPTLSTDYVDKAFAVKAGAELGRLAEAKRKYDNLDRNGKAARQLISHFQGYGINGVMYFWIWLKVEQEHMSQRDVAFMLGITESRVSQIVRAIKQD